MPHPKSGNTEKGFTLVEVLVALAAMAIGFVILWGMHFTSLRLQKSDQLRSDAMRLAQAIMEIERTDNTTTSGSNITVATQWTDSKYDRVRTGREQLLFDNCTVYVNWPYTWEKDVRVVVGWKERISIVGGGGTANQRTQRVEFRTVYILH